MKNVISQSFGLDFVNINVYAEVYKIFHSVQEIRPFSLFQNLGLGKASTDDKCHFAIVFFFQNLNLSKSSTNLNVIRQSHGVHLVNINVYAKFHHNIPLSSRDSAIIIFFRIRSSAKPQPMKKCHFAISWARFCQYQCLRNSLSKYSTQFKR